MAPFSVLSKTFYLNRDKLTAVPIYIYFFCVYMRAHENIAWCSDRKYQSSPKDNGPDSIHYEVSRICHKYVKYTNKKGVTHYLHLGITQLFLSAQGLLEITVKRCSRAARGSSAVAGRRMPLG